MRKYHVHVYRVVGLRESDIEADSEAEAMATMLRIAKKSKLFWGKSDCKYVAIVPGSKVMMEGNTDGAGS